MINLILILTAKLSPKGKENCQLKHFTIMMGKITNKMIRRNILYPISPDIWKMSMKTEKDKYK